MLSFNLAGKNNRRTKTLRPSDADKSHRCKQLRVLPASPQRPQKHGQDGQVFAAAAERKQQQITQFLS